MSSKIQTIYFLSAVILFCSVSLPAVSPVLSLIVDMPVGQITRKLDNARFFWLLQGLLTASVFCHLFAAIKLKNSWGRKQVLTWQWMRLFTGCYGSLFLLIHLVCVSAGRLLSGQAAGFYSGVAGMNTGPLQIAFMIYGILFAVFFFAPFIHSIYSASRHSLFRAGKRGSSVKRIGTVIRQKTVPDLLWDPRNSQ
ncbi:MAG: hypothetical protein ABW007_09780 [Chitinophagaceae bacterium]